MLPKGYLLIKFTVKNHISSSKTPFKQIIDKLFLFINKFLSNITIISNTNISNIPLLLSPLIVLLRKE
jgi:hypothetical protein